MEMMDEFLLQEGYIENQLHQQLEQVKKQRQESKAEIEPLTAEDLQVFRNQLRSKVEGELDMDTKKSVLNHLIKKLKVDQNGLL